MRSDIVDYIIIVFFIGITIAAIQKKVKFSTALLPLLLFSIVANVALAQNYTQSLIPGANDGMGISNRLAYFLIGDDGWSHELFRSAYNFSTTITIILLIAYSLILVIETVYKRKEGTVK